MQHMLHYLQHNKQCNRSLSPYICKVYLILYKYIISNPRNPQI